ncbi:hypothetical protein CCP3SC15_3050004 [Gammaproteobacteria bacterium]
MRYRLITLFVLFATIAFNFYLYNCSKRIFSSTRYWASSRHDSGRSGDILQAMRESSPASWTSSALTPLWPHRRLHGQRTTQWWLHVHFLKPLVERRVAADSIIARLRPQLGRVAGASLFLQPVQDIRMGGRPGGAQYQYSLLSADLEELHTWEPRIRAALEVLP